MGSRAFTCLFADDVRQEVGNKTSLMGIYDGDIIVPIGPPAALGRLVIVLFVTADIDDIPEKISIRITIPPERQQLVQFTFTPQPPTAVPDEDARRAVLKIILPFAPLLLTAPGLIEVFADAGNGEERVGRLKVDFASPADPMSVQAA